MSRQWDCICFSGIGGCLLCERLSFVFCTFNLRAYFLFCLVFVGILKGVRVGFVIVVGSGFLFSVTNCPA